jgi:hypothetical protein
VRACVAGWTLLLAALVAGTAGCEEPSQAEEDEGPDEDSDEPAGPPQILEPSDEVVVSAIERQDITIVAADLLPNARVEIDGRSWSLAEPAPVVRTGQTLRLPLAGALVVGTHELVLTHRDGKKELSSDPLTIRVEAAELSPLTASLAPEPVGAGDRLIDAGPSERLLAVVDDVAETIELRLGGWSQLGVTQSLPGVSGLAGPVSNRVDVTLAQVEQQRWLITTWLADGGARVRARITPMDADDQLGEPGEVLELWSLADPEHRAALGPHEVAIDHGVALLDRTVVIAVEARRDAEQASPGDRMLVTRWLTAEGTPANIQVMRGPSGRDLDLPHRARLFLDLGLDLGPSEPMLSLRVALAYPWLLELSGNGLPVLTEDPGEAGDVAGAIMWMASAEGALGARHTFALELLDGEQDEQARVRALRIDRWGSSSSSDVVELPALPTAAPSLAMVAGSPTLLIPFGVGTPAWAMRSTGEAVLLDSLAELDCDALALAMPDPDGEGESQTVACIANRELRVGTLGIN